MFPLRNKAFYHVVTVEMLLFIKEDFFFIW